MENEFRQVGLGRVIGSGGVFYLSAARVLEALIAHGMEAKEAWQLVQTRLVLPCIQDEIAAARERA